jgi:eukaryotic-like serine/threonine-protein kinase
VSADSWAETRRDFERLLELPPLERERWMRAQEPGRADATRELRALLAADAADDVCLDTDGPTLYASWLSGVAPHAAVGSEVAGYRLVEVLGEGGSATVYRAEGATTVAVKVLKPEACSPGLAKRFEQERETLAGLEHDGLIRVLGAGHLDDGRPYLITEHVAGEPIDVFCERAGLDLAARLRLFADVCRAVHHAHRHLVVHRDLKPANILVSAGGRPKVLDFGVAKLLDPARDPLWTDLYGRGPLTPAFASPEQIRGEVVTTAADIYSLGVLLHVLVTGASPYDEAPAQRDALERAVAAGRRRSPRSAALESGRAPPPQDVEAILERALALLPGERYASAEHLAQDVVCFLEQRPLLSRSEPWTRRAVRFARRRPWTLAACAAFLLLLSGSWIGTQRSLRLVTLSEGVAWRAHASAVQSTNVLADLLEQIGASAVGDEELARLVADTEQRLSELAEHPETEARLRMALARLERARGRPEAAAGHLARAVELSRDTRGLSWNDTERCLEQWSELLAQRGDERSIALARERLDLLVEHGDAPRAEQARLTLQALVERFATAGR